MSLTTLDRLFLLLRPPGQGVYVHSTGGHYAAPLLESLYGSSSERRIQKEWQGTLQRMDKADTLLLGIPSDTGAGMLRGSNFGPLGIRLAYHRRFGTYPPGVLDIGDVICVPQLLHDGMLNAKQIRSTREALYPNVSEPLPVSPLSIGEHVFDLLFQLNGKKKIILLGGDHGVTWPAMSAWCKRFGNDFALLQLDAHDDLSESRLGIKHCYSTWAYHTMKLLKPYHLVQVGLRNSDLTRAQWRQKFPVLQFWADEVIGREEETMSTIKDHFDSLGIRNVYISNDIDATDPKYAPATGTPEPGGMKPSFIKRIIRHMCRHFDVIAGNIMEVAPPLLAKQDFARDKTCRLAAAYLHVLCQRICR